MPVDTTVLRGRPQETFLSVDVTGSLGRTLAPAEAAIKTLRFTGTLGQSITLRVPLVAAENPGYTGTFVNATSGGFTITIAPAVGTGAPVAPGAAITAFYDGANMVGEAAAAATALPATIGGAVTFIPIVLTNPAIGDAVSFNGTAFVNTPAGAATMAVGSAVAGGTTGSVLFVGPGPVLAQDNANLFFADATNRLGIGTNAPNAPLHVLNNGADTLATFHSTSTFASVFLELGDGGLQAALRIYPSVNATVGAPIVGTGGVIMRGRYWNGSANIDVDGWWRLRIDAVTPTYYLSAGLTAGGGSEVFHIRSDGQTTLGNTIPFNNPAVTQKIILGSTAFFSNHVTMNDTADFILGTGTGTRWGTGATQLQGWWGATPVARAAAPTGTDSQKIAGLITILGSYGLLG